MSDKGTDTPDIEASLERKPLLSQIKYTKYGRFLTPIALLVAVVGTGLLLSSVQSNLYQATPGRVLKMNSSPFMEAMKAVPRAQGVVITGGKACVDGKCYPLGKNLTTDPRGNVCIDGVCHGPDYPAEMNDKVMASAEALPRAQGTTFKNGKVCVDGECYPSGKNVSVDGKGNVCIDGVCHGPDYPAAMNDKVRASAKALPRAQAIKIDDKGNVCIDGKCYGPDYPNDKVRASAEGSMKVKAQSMDGMDKAMNDMDNKMNDMDNTMDNAMKDMDKAMEDMDNTWKDIDKAREDKKNMPKAKNTKSKKGGVRDATTEEEENEAREIEEEEEEEGEGQQKDKVMAETGNGCLKFIKGFGCVEYEGDADNTMNDKGQKKADMKKIMAEKKNISPSSTN